MSTFTILFLSLGIIVGALVRSCGLVRHTGHPALVVALVAVGVASLFMLQATSAGFEAISAILFWIIGYAFGLLACMGYFDSKHRTP